MQTIHVHVTPKSGKDEVCGFELDADGKQELRVRVTAAPDGGAANKAVCKLLAKDLGVAKSKVQITRGQTSRHKQVEIDMPDAAFEAWLSNVDAEASL